MKTESSAKKARGTNKTPPRPVALVTGSGRRLGRQIALALGASGYDIIVNYNRSPRQGSATVEMLNGLGARAIAVKADVSWKPDVSHLVAEAIKHFGRIDLLVNNAAVFSVSPFLETTEDVWDTTIDINLKGVFLCSQAVAPIMLKQKKGRIINIASLGGLQAWRDHVPYNVSKAGVVMLTKIMARALAPKIAVNAIAPGTIIIPGEEDADIRHVPVASIPLGRYGRPADIVNTVLFLATSAGYITGQVIAVDGGRSIFH
jgi:NAD(P)-dependent dehydrogenase (short-subunit alcohol dehydrogenase family)